MVPLDRVLTDDEIIEKWEKNEDARNRGTEAHLQMELWLNSEALRLDNGEVIVGLDFTKNCLAPIGASVPHRVDNIRGGRNVAGCIDGALIMPDSPINRLETVGETGGKMFGYRNMRAPPTTAGL